MTTTTVRYEAPVAPVPTLRTVRPAPRYIIRTVGPRHTVADTLTGYTVAAYWTLPEAVAALAARTAVH